MRLKTLVSKTPKAQMMIDLQTKIRGTATSKITIKIQGFRGSIVTTKIGAMTKGILVTMVGTGEITPTKQHKAMIGVKIHIMSRMLPIKASHEEMKIVLCMAMVQVMLPPLGTKIIVRET